MGTARRERRASRAAGEPRAGAGRPGVARHALWIVLLLIALDLVVYAQVWRHDFTSFDDPDYVTRNPQVAAGLTWGGLVWAFTTAHAANWHPLTWLSHMLDVDLFGLSAGPHHLVNVLLHIVNTLLVFGVLRRMTGRWEPSAVVAGLFGVHPLHVESVAWVAERKDVLSTLFWLLTLWAYVGYARRPGLGRYLRVLGLFAAGLMAKPMLVTLPFVLLLLDFWPLGRLAATPGPTGRPGPMPSIDPRAALRAITEKVPLLALTVAASVVTFAVHERGGAVGGFEAFPLGQRVANATVSYVAYLGKMVWPSGLAALYPYPESLPSWWVIGSAVALVAVSVAVMLSARRFPYLAVGWFWYVGTLVPVIGLVQVGLQSMAADRYTYIPLIGPFIALAWGVSDLAAGWPRRRVALPIAAAVAIGACALVASLQVRYWRNSEALWARAVEVTRDNHRAHNDLGNVLGAQGRVDEAVAHYTEALRLRPDFVEAYINLGNLWAARGRADEAMARYADALRLRPGFAAAHNNLGFLLATQGRVDEAIAHYAEALRSSPGFVEAHRNLGIALASRGRVDEAMRELRETVRLKPDDAEAHYRLGVLLADQGKIDEAARHFETAARLDPRFQKVRRVSSNAMGPRASAGLETR